MRKLIDQVKNFGKSPINETFETINKYLIIREYPYEGKDTWTVFAASPEEAKEFVVKDSLHFKGGNKSELTYQMLKSNIKGSKFKGIHKRGNVSGGY